MKQCPVDHKLLAAQHAAQGKSKVSDASSEPSGKCPVDHARLRETGEVRIAADSAGGSCPVDHGALRGAERGRDASAGDGAKCPVDHAARGGGAMEGGKPQKAVCPFGFGSEEAGGPTMTSLHCPKCRALFYECTKTNCGHNFCQACMPAGKECLQCGDQVTDLRPDPKVQGLVDTFVATHSADDKFLGAKEDADAKDPDTVKAEFLLETALQSFAGRNFTAAAARLRLCRDHLLHMSDPSRDDPKLSVQIGAVCGSLGDCSLQLGDAEGAVREYRASIQHLENSSSKSAEVKKALTVTQNKLGDLWYQVGDLRAAREQYRHALGVRRDILAAAATDAERRLAELDIGLSLAKVADIHQALDDSKSSDTLLGEAREIAGRLDTQKQELDQASRKRLQALAAFLAG